MWCEDLSVLHLLSDSLLSLKHPLSFYQHLESAAKNLKCQKFKALTL